MDELRASAGPTDMAAWLASRPLGAFHIRLVAVCFAIAAVDGFDTQCIAFVAPRLLHEWALQPGSFGPLFSAGLFGTMLGAVGLGAAADRFGRRPLVLICVTLFGAMSLVSATADSVSSLALYRFVGGLGLGGVIPNIISLASEYSPSRYRATTIVTMFCGFPLGALVGGAVSAPLIAQYGWASVFVLGGVAPLLIAAVAFFALPESARYLDDMGRTEDLRDVLERVGAHPPMHQSPRASSSAGFRSLFEGGRGAWTVQLWLLFFAGMLLTYFLINWTPLLLIAVGVSEQKAITAVVILNAGGVVGALLIGRFMDRVGMFAALTAALLIGTASVLALGLTVGGSAWLTLALTGVVGATVFGAQMNFASLAVCNYPVRIRGAGVGWAMGVGRFGSVVGPLLGGALVGAGLQTQALFSLAALPAAAALLLIAGMKRMQAVQASRGPVDRLIVERPTHD